MRPGAVRQAATALVVLALAAGCTGGGAASGSGTRAGTATTSPAPATSSPTAAPSPSVDLPTVSSYVALGDSYTAGPGIPTVRESGGFCFRSDHNYPTLLAAELRASTVRDVSCSGATTANVTGGSKPQLDAVTRGTKLVTLGIGGNDGNLFASLIRACTGGATGCGAFAREDAPAIARATVPRVVEALRAVRAKAPDATVLLVGYLRIMPSSGTCDAVGIPAADVASVVTAEEALESSLATAARTAGVRYVSVRAASAGHDACAGDQAWTNGAVVSGDDGIVFHPRLRGMQAVADLVGRAVADAS